MIELKLHSDGSERVPYQSGAFPLHLSVCTLSMYPGMSCVSHWHDDYEFAVALKGRFVCRVNGVPVPVSAGEGLYVAPRNVHSMEAVGGEDCEYLCAVFPAALLSASRHITDVIQASLAVHEAAHFLRLLPSVPQHREVLQGLKRLERIVYGNERDAELRSLGVIYQLIADLGASVRDEAALSEPDRNLSQIKDMIGYIRLHADRKLTLSDIARAGKLSRTSCENAFRRMLHVSPVQFLINCRLERGMELLISTPLSITEIAYACGFSSGSYFAEQFRKRAGCSPADFRKKQLSPQAPSGR